MHFEVIVELVAGLRFGAASTPDFAIQRDQPDLPGRFGARTPTNAGHAFNQRQLMIFLQEHHHTVLELNPFGFLGMKRGKLRNWNLIPLLSATR